eukprot:148753_1
MSLLNILNIRRNVSISQRRIKDLYNITSDINFIRAAFCGTSLDYDEYKNDNTSLCDLMKVYEKYYTFCSCNLWRIVAANSIKNIDKDTSEYTGNNFKQSITNTYVNAIRTLAKNYNKHIGYSWTLLAPYWGCNIGDDYFVCNVTQQYEKLNNNDDNMETTPSPP